MQLSQWHSKFTLSELEFERTALIEYLEELLKWNYLKELLNIEYFVNFEKLNLDSFDIELDRLDLYELELWMICIEKIKDWKVFFCCKSDFWAWISEEKEISFKDFYYFFIKNNILDIEEEKRKDLQELFELFFEIEGDINKEKELEKNKSVLEKVTIFFKSRIEGNTKK